LKEMSMILASIVVSYEIAFVLSIVIYSAISWSRTRQVADWMNGWNDIDDHLCIICPPERWEESRELTEAFWRYAVFYIALPTILCGSGILAFTADWNYPFYMVLVLVSVYLPNAVVMSKDTMLILMFRTLEMAIRCVRSRSHYFDQLNCKF
jgi:hypothetical protein